MGLTGKLTVTHHRTRPKGGNVTLLADWQGPEKHPARALGVLQHPHARQADLRVMFGQPLSSVYMVPVRERRAGSQVSGSLCAR